MNLYVVTISDKGEDLDEVVPVWADNAEQAAKMACNASPGMFPKIDNANAVVVRGYARIAGPGISNQVSIARYTATMTANGVTLAD